MSLVVLYSVSSTGADEGQRLAALSIVRSGGMTNCSRTDVQKRSSGDAGVGGRSAGRAQAFPGVMKGAAPPMASNRAKSRRFIVPPGPAAAGRMYAEILRHAITGRRFFHERNPPASRTFQAHGAVHQDREGRARRHGAPERQAMLPQSAGIAVDQLDVNPVDEQRMLSDENERTEDDAAALGERGERVDAGERDHQDADAYRKPRRRAGPEQRRVVRRRVIDRGPRGGDEADGDERRAGERERGVDAALRRNVAGRGQ